MEYSLPTARRLRRRPKIDSRFVKDLNAAILGAMKQPLAPILEAVLSFGLLDREVRPKVSNLADYLGISARTLRQHLRDEELPPTKKLLEGCLVLRAANYLCHTDMTVQGVADRLGIPDAHTLRRIIERYLGMPPRQLHDATQWKGVLETFVRSL